MKIIIAGAYTIGTYLAQFLSRNKYNIILIDEQEERLNKIGQDYDLLTLQGKPTSIQILQEADVKHADLFIAVDPKETTNITACTMAHHLGAKKTVAKIDNPEYLEPKNQELFKQLGVDSLIYPELLAAKDIINGLKMSWVRQRWDVRGGALVMLGIKLRDTCAILDKPLREISGPNDPYHIVAIKRRNETIIPGGNETLQREDLAYFMTTKEYIPYVRKFTGKEHYVDVKNVMIMGGGRTAVRSVKIMPEYMDIKIIENSFDRCEYLNEMFDESVLVINGDGRDTDLLIEEGIRHTQAFVALTPNAETNILACMAAKNLGVRKTIAAVENFDYVDMAANLDIGTIINKRAIAAGYIYQMLLDANVSNVRFLMSVDADVAEFIPVQGSRITQKPIKDVNIPSGMTIGGLVRHDVGMLVSGNTQIEAGDIVVVFCYNANMKKVEQLFN